MQTRITKVKLNTAGCPAIGYEQENSQGNMGSFYMNPGEQAVPGFVMAWENLRQDVITMRELKDVKIDEITIISVSLSYGGADEIMGAIINAKQKLKNSLVEVAVPTPHKTCKFYTENQSGDQKQLLDEACQERLSVLFDYAVKYVEDDRAEQGELFQETEEEKEPEKKLKVA